MPQLPSGRHVGITANPLLEILDNLEDEENYAQLKRINSVSDIFPFIEVVYLETAVPGNESKIIIPITSQPPSNLKEVPSGIKFKLCNFSNTIGLK